MKLLETARTIGRYQWLVLLLYVSWNITEWYNLGILVMAPELVFQCSEGGVASNESQCYVDNVNGTILANSSQSRATPYGGYSDSDRCQEFEFDHTNFEWTLTERYLLVCDRKWIISMMKTVCLAGYFLCSLCFGYLADRFGRKGMAVFGGSGFILMTICQIFVPIVWAYVVLRFLQAIFSFCFYLSMYILATESLRKEQRFFPVMMECTCYDLFTGILGAVSFLVKNYVHFHIIFAASGTITILMVFCLVQESPRWMYAKQRAEDANGAIRKIAKFNKTDVEELRYLMKKCEQDRITPMSLFKTPLIRKRTIILMYLWFVSVFGFFAISYNINEFYADVRLSLLFSGAVELLSTLPVALLIKKFGRSACLFALFLGSGLCCLAMAPLVQFTTHPGLLTLALTGRLMTSNALFLTYLYTPELYPTVIRATGLGVCNTASRVVGAIAPQVALLNDYWPPAMVVTLGIVMISSCFVIPLLPDTTDVELPQTIEDGENLFPDHRYNLRKAKANLRRVKIDDEAGDPSEECL